MKAKLVKEILNESFNNINEIIDIVDDNFEDAEAYVQDIYPDFTYNGKKITNVMYEKTFNEFIQKRFPNLPSKNFYKLYNKYAPQ